MMKYLQRISAIALLLLGLQAVAVAAEYNFSIPKADVVVTIEPEGSAFIYYTLTFKCSPGAHVIDIVDIGMPSSKHKPGGAAINGIALPASAIKKSTYIDNAYEVHLGNGTIKPGQSGVFEFTARSYGMVWQDTTRKEMASFQFSPTWFGSKYVRGNTELSLRFKLPPGEYPEPDRSIVWHKSTPPFDMKGVVDGEDTPSVIWKQVYSMTGPRKFGVSFPKAYVTKIKQTSTFDLFLRWFKGNSEVMMLSGIILIVVFLILFNWATNLTGLFPCGLFTIGMIIGMVASPTFHLWLYPGFLVLGIAVWRFKYHTKRSYIPASISKEGGKVCNTLTAVEAALLLDQPVSRIVSLLTFDLLDRGIVEIVSEKPLKLKPSGKMKGHSSWVMPDGKQLSIEPYERKFLRSLVSSAQVPLESVPLQDTMKALTRIVTNKVKDCDLKRTREYCEFRVAQAWKKLTEETNIELRTKYADQNHGWLAIADDSEEKWGGLERDYDYRYYPRWHSYGWYHHHHQRQAPTLGISLPASDPSAPSFRDVFDSFTGQLDNIGDKMVDLPINASRSINLEAFDKIASESLSSGGGYSGGGGCACACAGCACACACAGGGR